MIRAWGAGRGPIGTNSVVFRFAEVLDLPASVLKRCDAAMEIGRHAKRRMRLYDLTSADLAAAIADPIQVSQDGNGNTAYWVAHPAHRYIRVVVAADRPDFIISAHPRRKLPED